MQAAVSGLGLPMKRISPFHQPDGWSPSRHSWERCGRALLEYRRGKINTLSVVTAVLGGPRED
ncbi:MAG: hypothetical protein IJ519_01030 [Clostridia bacterium]|nr:hypothetical protein [Clostridia bacterium]